MGVCVSVVAYMAVNKMVFASAFSSSLDHYVDAVRIPPEQNANGFSLANRRNRINDTWNLTLELYVYDSEL